MADQMMPNVSISNYKIAFNHEIVLMNACGYSSKQMAA
jgi:hypothetical protein